jgi:primosomal protein N' (replication factor Y)
MDKRQQSLFAAPEAPWVEDDQEDFLIAKVVFSEQPFGPYDYRVPEEWRTQIGRGKRVLVPLGRGNRTREAYCVDLYNAIERSDELDKRRLKDLRKVIDRDSLLDAEMIDVARWISQHYVTPLGQVIETVVPSSVRSQAGTREVVLLDVPNAVIAKLTQLKLPAKQAEVLKTLAASPKPLTVAELAKRSGCTAAPIQALRKKGLIRESTKRVETGDHTLDSETDTVPAALNPQQEGALAEISGALNSGEGGTFLLHGITGSGKTEVYIRAIQQVLNMGRQAIVLVPEISLTPQTRRRFRSRFQRVAVMHSHLSQPERHWHWQRIRRGEIDVVVGARSAVFAPTPRLGLIVIDEEHDSSFKQDNIPRYHARDVARYRASVSKVPLVLGSATPSLESWHDSQESRSHLISLPGRVRDLPLPEVAIVDLRNEFRSKKNWGMISAPLTRGIRETVAEKGQVMLLLNRRGFATSIQCPACGFVVNCPNCDLALTHHRDGRKAVCHYCDYLIPEPSQCPECLFDGIRFAGFGTQKLEEEVQKKFPEVACLRMDSDTMKKPGSHEMALERFRQGEVQILLGTQMIAKGLDFPNVMLVGVINADTALHFPDFRAAERTFGLVTQVAGRTGRGDRGGRVFVQTFTPDHPAIVLAARHDYAAFAEQELPVRESLRYPPWGSMARFVVRGPLETQTQAFADQLGDQIRQHLEKDAAAYRVLGPAPCPIAKLRNKFRFHLLVQGLNHQPLQEVVARVSEALQAPEDVQWIVDIDPLDML